jgi:hypothetical protein
MPHVHTEKCPCHEQSQDDQDDDVLHGDVVYEEDELDDEEDEEEEDDSIPVPPDEICEYCDNLATAEAGGLFLCDDCLSDYADGFDNIQMVIYGNLYG